MKRPALGVLALLAGCSIVVDEDAPAITLVDAPMPIDVRVPARAEPFLIVEGGDGVDWLARETAHGLEVDRMVAPTRSELVQSNLAYTTTHAFFIVEPMSDGTMTLTVRRAGDTAPRHVHVLPSSYGQLLTSSDGAVYAWVGFDASSLEVHRVDDDSVRRIDSPTGLRWSDGDPLRMSLSGDLLFTSASNRRFRPTGWTMIAHSTREQRDVELDAPLLDGNDVRVDEAAGALLVCSLVDGVVAVSVDGTPRRVLDPTPCLRIQSNLVDRSPVAYYALAPSTTEVRTVALDGSTPPRTVLTLDARRGLLDVGGTQAAYTTTRGLGTFDGWVGAWRFMERGLDVQFASDGKRLRWIDHADDTANTGDLYVATPGDAAPLHLARNAAGYLELADGRLVFVDDKAFAGPQNRVVIVDEKRARGRVLARATHFTPTPDGKALVVSLFEDDESLSLARIAIPPIDP